MWRDTPVGYLNLVRYGWDYGAIKNQDAREYYEIIDEITRGPLFDRDRMIKVININLGKYDYLVENYKQSLDENGRVIRGEKMSDDYFAGY